ncbi:DUF4307 domain-containing protein [Streptomyces orinoci]|uniref:DUF4307 domain-containing protein n=1 Tax=Streptomyces orinoci TaxID=67339 RepID=A0ABV3JSB1_STRON|nr:DUF4307 domain-containing protein [Streptomyces orinoci]
MAAESPTLPEGRYGRTADQRADRKLKIAAIVLGTALAGGVGWAGVHYLTAPEVTGQLIRSRTVSDSSVQAVLEIRKDKSTEGVCTLRSLGSDGNEVARKDVPLERGRSHFTQLVTLRTTAWAAATDLEGCRTASNS